MSLLGLPNELIVHLTRTLDLRSLMQLFLSNRELNDVLFTELYRRGFARQEQYAGYMRARRARFEQLCDFVNIDQRVVFAQDSAPYQLAFHEAPTSHFHKLNSMDVRAEDARDPASYTFADTDAACIVDDGRSPSYRFPLHWLCARGHEDLVRSLLRYTGAASKTRGGWVDVHAKDDYNCTALWYAAAGGYRNIAQMLLDVGGYPHEQLYQGRTVLSIAAGNGHEEIVEDLLLLFRQLEGRPDKTPPLLPAAVLERDCPDKGGFTPLTHACRNGHWKAAKLLLDQQAERYGYTVYLPQPGDGVSQEQWMDACIIGSSPLLQAVRGGHMQTVMLLLEHGQGDVNLMAPLQRTPLSLAVERGDFTITWSLLHATRDKDSRDFFGRSPLMHAVRIGDTVIARLLLYQAIDPEQTDNAGRSLFDVAEGNKEMTDILWAATVFKRVRMSFLAEPLDEGLAAMTMGPSQNEMDEQESTAMLAELIAAGDVQKKAVPAEWSEWSEWAKWLHGPFSSPLNLIPLYLMVLDLPDLDLPDDLPPPTLPSMRLRPATDTDDEDEAGLEEAATEAAVPKSSAKGKELAHLKRAASSSAVSTLPKRSTATVKRAGRVLPRNGKTTASACSRPGSPRPGFSGRGAPTASSSAGGRLPRPYPSLSYMNQTLLDKLFPVRPLPDMTGWARNGGRWLRNGGSSHREGAEPAEHKSFYDAMEQIPYKMLFGRDPPRRSEE